MHLHAGLKAGRVQTQGREATSCNHNDEVIQGSSDLINHSVNHFKKRSAQDSPHNIFSSTLV